MIQKPRESVKCPHCEYTCKGMQALGRHIHYRHPTMSKTGEIAVPVEALHGLLQLTHELVARKKRNEDYTDLENQLQDEDIQLRLNLVAVSIAKSARIADLQLKLQELDALLEKKLGEFAFDKEGKPILDKEGRQLSYLETLTPNQLIALRKNFGSDIVVDVEFLQSILLMKEEKDSTFFSRLIEVLARTGTNVNRMIVGRGQVVAALELRDHRHIAKLVKSYTSGDARGKSNGKPDSPTPTDATRTRI